VHLVSRVVDDFNSSSWILQEAAGLIGGLSAQLVEAIRTVFASIHDELSARYLHQFTFPESWGALSGHSVRNGVANKPEGAGRMAAPNMAATVLSSSGSAQRRA